MYLLEYCLGGASKSSIEGIRYFELSLVNFLLMFMFEPQGAFSNPLSITFFLIDLLSILLLLPFSENPN